MNLAISKRIPGWGQILPVYAVIVLIVHSWTILWFFWKLPGWLFFLNLWEILTAFAYAIAANFVESLLVLIAPVLLCLILPRKWFYDDFVARGSTLAMAGMGYMMYLAYQLKSKVDYADLHLRIWSLPLALGGILLVAFLAVRVALLRKIIESIANRATIFLYITIPLGIASLVLILIRSTL